MATITTTATDASTSINGHVLELAAVSDKPPVPGEVAGVAELDVSSIAKGQSICDTQDASSRLD